MEIIACIDLAHTGPYFKEPLSDRVTAFDCVVRYVNSLPELSKVFIIAPDGLKLEDLPTGWSLETRPVWTASAIVGLLQRITNNGSPETTVVYLPGDAPFLNPELTLRMLQSHRRYYSEYTFADGFPDGYAPELLDPVALERMAPLAARMDGPAGRSVLFDIISSDINAFDLETELSEQDLRNLRLELYSDIKRRHLLCASLFRKTSGGEDLLEAIQRNAESLMTLPAYISIQITRRPAQRVSYLPDFEKYYHTLPEEMPAEQYRKILHSIQEFAPDSVIGISYHGEAALHSEILKIIRMTSEETDLSLLVETSGVGWSETVIEDLAKRPPERTRWIFELDASEAGLYQVLRGGGFEQARGTAIRMIEAAPGAVWVQAVRFRENENDLEAFYRGWKSVTPNVIIQKYNHYCGLLQDKRPANLAPLERHPCWHLKRDCIILTDGTVPLCGQDLEIRHSRGNVINDGLEAVWEAGRATYRSHIEREYPSLCSECDEYYTFNF